MKDYRVIGNHEMSDATLLEDFDLCSEAIRFAQGYTRRENMGNWDVVAVVDQKDGVLWTTEQK